MGKKKQVIFTPEVIINKEKRKIKNQKLHHIIKKRPIFGFKTIRQHDDEDDMNDEREDKNDDDEYLELMENDSGAYEEQEQKAMDMYAELRQDNRKQIKNRTRNKIDFLANTPASELIYFSRYATSLIPKLQESLSTFTLKKTPPLSNNLKEVVAYLNASFDMGAGAVGFLNYTWKQIADSGVELVDSELQRVMMAKIIMNAVSPEKYIKDDIQPTLVSVNLYSREAVFEIRGLGENHIVIEVGDIDACLLACVSNQSRQFVIPQVCIYVRAVMPSALEDGNFSHSSLEVLGSL